MNKGEVEKKEGKYLPIGTVVLLKEAERRIMIIGYLYSVKAQKEGEKNQVFDYSGCLYPEGLSSPDKILLFNHNQIEKIYYEGLKQDSEEEIFMKKVIKIKEERENK